MRENLVIAVCLGLFFFMATAVMTAVAVRYGTPSLLWTVILCGGVAGMVMTAATLAIFISAQVTGRPFLMPALLINFALCLLMFGLVMHFSPATESADTTSNVSDAEHILYNATVARVAPALSQFIADRRRADSIRNFNADWNEQTQQAMKYSNETMSIFQERFGADVVFIADVAWRLKFINDMTRSRFYRPTNPLGVEFISQQMSLLTARTLTEQRK